MLSPKVIGFDVGKNSLVVALPEVKGSKSFQNTQIGISKLCDYLPNFDVQLIIVEAYHYQELAHGSRLVV